MSERPDKEMNDTPDFEGKDVRTETGGEVGSPDFVQEPGTAISTWVDGAMYSAEDIDAEAMAAPRVHLLSATPDPLGAVAAACMIYEGRVVRDLTEITDDERRHYFDQCFKTTLKAPLEFVDLHFMVEAVTRSHTHQEVRQRTAVFAQESMRFAVKEKIAARPGPLIRQNPEAYKRWQELMERIWNDYHALIGNGIPAEEARGILPHDTLTRMHHKVNLRNLMDEVGKRLCTQAQFEWKMWAASLRRAIYEYSPHIVGEAARLHHPLGLDGGGFYRAGEFPKTAWQFQYIAESPIFVPICFNTGQCMFKADMDRGCTIRERVEAGDFHLITADEWAMDPTAGWVR